jgi:hypothetical protein
MTRHLSIAPLVLLGASCRFGGPEGSPTELIEIDAGVPVEERDAASGTEEDDPPPIPPIPSTRSRSPWMRRCPSRPTPRAARRLRASSATR